MPIQTKNTKNEVNGMGEYQDNFKRYEVKYLLSAEQYAKLKKRLEKIAAVDAYGETKILNIYYDTPSFSLIRTSLEKPVYKEKLRLRSYGTASDTTNSFVEIKKKYDGIVYKRRINLPYKKAEAYLNKGLRVSGDEAGNEQIVGEIDAFKDYYEGLAPKMMISYDRIAMAGIHDPELRITFDRNICWRTEDLDLRHGGYGRTLLEEGQVLMEVKILGAMSMELSRILSELEIFPASFSKYGRGYVDMISMRRVGHMVAGAYAIHTGKGAYAYAG